MTNPMNPSFPAPATPGLTPLATTRAEMTAWLDRCEAELAQPAMVTDRLSHLGWAPGAAASVAVEYRNRFDEHGLGYGALLMSTGVAALATGTTAHLAARGITGPVDRSSLAMWLTVALTAFPFAVWAHRWAARVDREDPVAVWSGPRRALAKTLVAASITVGVLRMMTYVFQLLSALLVAHPDQNGSAPVVQGLVNVGATVAIALPLGLWAWTFLHRFDEEDATRPKPRTRTTRAASVQGGEARSA